MGSQSINDKSQTIDSIEVFIPDSGYIFNKSIVA